MSSLTYWQRFEVFSLGYLNVNDEQENYQAENIQVRDGSLVITGRKEQKGQQNYTSGRVNTSVRSAYRLDVDGLLT